jgi:ketosteroid isomerase-like protein
MKAAACAMVGLLILSSAPLAQQKASSASDEAALRALEDKWAAALLNADANALASILADTWVVTYVDGKVDNKAGELAALRAGTLKVSAYKNDDVRVFLYGDAAVATGRASMKGVANGKAIDMVMRWTDVFVRQNGQWKAVATQGTPIK